MNGNVEMARLLRVPRHLMVAGSAWASRIVSAVVQLASVRVLMGSLGVEHYAVFALLTGLMGWFALAEMGVGASVQNYISESRAKNMPHAGLINAAVLLSAILLLLVVIPLYYVSPYAAPLLLKQFGFMTLGEKTDLFFITGSLSVAIGVGNIVYKVWYAEQKGYLSNLIPALASIVGFCGLLLARLTPPDERLMWSVAAFMLPSAAFPLIALGAMRRRVAAELCQVSGIRAVRMIAKRAMHFWLFSVMAVAVLQIDYVVMSQFLLPRDIAVYNISTKVFGLAFFVYGAVLLALWPVFAESIAKGEWHVVWRHTRKYLLLGMAFMFACTALLTWLMPAAFGILAPHEDLAAPLGFILLVGAYQTIRVWTDTFSMILQSMNDLVPFWILVPLQAIIGGALQWMLAPRWGIYGIMVGLIGSFCLTVLWGLPLAVSRNYRISLARAQ